MKSLLKSVSALALVGCVAACGGEKRETTTEMPGYGEQVAAAGQPAATAPVPGAPVATDTPVPEGSASPTPAPSASAGAGAAPAAAASAAATPVAAAGPAPRPAIFAMCGACHSVEAGQNGLGPSLAGVFGARAGHVSSFTYSEAMEGSGLTWNEANLNRFLENPQGTVPGTKMAFPGLRDAEQRQAVIAYLKGL